MGGARLYSDLYIDNMHAQVIMRLCVDPAFIYGLVPMQQYYTRYTCTASLLVNINTCMLFHEYKFVLGKVL